MFSKTFFVFLLALFVCAVRGETEGELVHFDGWKVARVDITQEKHFATIKSWELDVWSHESVLVKGTNDIMVNDDHIAFFQQNDIKYEIIINDVEDLIEQERKQIRFGDVQADFFSAYHTYDEIVAYVKNLTSTYPTQTTYTANIGNSVQGRAIPAITIGSKTPTKKIFINGGQHAREWIAPATVLYIVDQLLAQSATNSTISQLLNQVQIVVVPLVNPDGYVYAWSTNRLWRKNRKLNTGGSYGVDLNRNWNDHFGGEGSSSSPTSDTYHGLSPFSEAETKALSDFMNKTGQHNGYIDFHSYSQLILRPYGWQQKAPDNDAVVKAIGEGIKSSIKSVDNKDYTNQASWQLYYTTGSAQDWAFSQANIKISFTIELRDTGTYGFQLPASQIIPTGRENYAGFVYFIQSVLKN